MTTRSTVLLSTLFVGCAGMLASVSAAVLPNTTSDGTAYLTVDRAVWATIAPFEAYTDISGTPTSASGPTADAAGQRWMFTDRFEGKAWNGASYPSSYLTGPTAPLSQPVGGFPLEVNKYTALESSAAGFDAKHKLTNYNSTSAPNGFVGLGGSFRTTSDFNEPGASVWWEFLAVQQGTDSIWRIVATRGTGQGSVFELTNVTTETVNCKLHLSGDYIFGNSDWYAFLQGSTAATISQTAVLGHIEIVPTPEPTTLSALAGAGMLTLRRRRSA